MKRGHLYSACFGFLAMVWVDSCVPVERPQEHGISTDASEFLRPMEPRGEPAVEQRGGVGEPRVSEGDGPRPEPPRREQPGRPEPPRVPEEPRRELLPELGRERIPDGIQIPDRTPPASPPFSGTIFVEPKIILDSDPSTFVSLTPAGTGSRRMYDRRISAYKTFVALLFQASFSDGLSIEVQVNPEFSRADAEKEARRYLPVIGQLPYALRVDVKTVWIHKGAEAFGGGNNNLLIHVDKGQQYIAQGILAETLVHEACHTSLDAAHANHPDWKRAQAKDGQFISTYARDNPVREDVAETFLMFLAFKYRSHRISAQLKQTLLQTIPHRMKYFEAQKLNMLPIK